MRMRRVVVAVLFLLSLASAQYVLRISNPNSYQLTNFQVRVRLPSDLVGVPISITSSSGGSVPFCYETSSGECSTDPSACDGYIWVKVPSIPASGSVDLTVTEGINGAVPGDQVFDFYDDFDQYSNGALYSNSKWIVTRYSNDPYNECVVQNGILWLVTKSKYKGCNIMAREFRIKYYSKAIIEMHFKVDYVCGTTNDGDGIAIVIDGKSNSPWYGCSKGFNVRSQGIDIKVLTDDSSGVGYVTIGKYVGGCTYSSSYDLASIRLPSKRYDLSDGILRVELTGSSVSVYYKDLNPTDGEREGTISYPIWNPSGYGYLMIGAGAGTSRCCCDGRDSAHGVDWIRVRKYAPLQPTYAWFSAPLTTTVTKTVTVTERYTYITTKVVFVPVTTTSVITVTSPTVITITQPVTTTVTTTVTATSVVSENGEVTTVYTPIVVTSTSIYLITTTKVITVPTTTTVTDWITVTSYKTVYTSTWLTETTTTTIETVVTHVTSVLVQTVEGGVPIPAPVLLAPVAAFLARKRKR